MWRVDQHQHKEQWALVLEINGEQCVTPTGQMQMPKWCVASWVIQVKRMVLFQLLSGSYYGPGSASTYCTTVGGCRGNESIITACAFTTRVPSCYSTNHAGVSCYSKLCLSPTECNRRSDA